jgi:hypothetical protein
MAPPLHEPKARRIWAIWLLLVIATVVSWTVGVDHGIDYRLSTTLVLVVTFLKVNLVGMNFMDLREAVPPLRAIFNTFCIIGCVGLTVMYLAST